MTRNALFASTVIGACLVSAPTLAGELPYGLDAYAGAFGGWGGSRALYSSAAALTTRSYSRVDRHSYSAFGGAYAGLGWQFFAVEAGWLRLPGYHSSVDGLNPTRHANQTIDGSAFFARGLIRAPRDWTVQPYVFMGAARVKSSSHEVGECPTCGAGYVSDWTVNMRTTAPYVGAGFEVPIVGPLSARAEAGFIPRAVNSWWSANRDYYLGSVALQVRF